VLLAIPALASCAAPAMVATVGRTAGEPHGPATEALCDAGVSGSLVVYSATYPQTLEQSEYPAHTNYTVSTVDDKIIERVANNRGSYGASPSIVELPCGDYHVLAQYGRGRFVVVPVSIRAGRTTVVDLDGEPLPPGAPRAQEPIRLPGGELAGWRAIIG
jgi:hypothetical protein